MHCHNLLELMTCYFTIGTRILNLYHSTSLSHLCAKVSVSFPSPYVQHKTWLTFGSTNQLSVRERNELKPFAFPLFLTTSGSLHLFLPSDLGFRLVSLLFLLYNILQHFIVFVNDIKSWLTFI